jgi:hypothetical protein
MGRNFFEWDHGYAPFAVCFPESRLLSFVRVALPTKIEPDPGPHGQVYVRGWR